MNILVVGNVLKDVYLNLDNRTENFEVDKNNTKWLNLSFNASEHNFFNRNSSLGGSAVSLEVFEKMGISATISDSDLKFKDGDLIYSFPIDPHRYILISGENEVSYLVPSKYRFSDFTPPADSYDYLYIDRSAKLNLNTIKKIHAYLDISKKTKLIYYAKNFHNSNLDSLVSRASLVFYEKPKTKISDEEYLKLRKLDPEKTIIISDNLLSYKNLSERISLERIDVLTHLSIYSITSATILAGFILGYSVEHSLKLARANVENSKISSALYLKELEKLASVKSPKENLELIANSLVLPKKGILAADESGGSIKKKFAKLGIPDTFENRRDYRNLLLTTSNLENYVNGVILFDETARQFADNGQTFVDYLIGRRIIPGIKVDEGLETFKGSTETYTKGLLNLPERLKEYYEMGLRFAKWRSAFEITHSESGEILTPSTSAIEKNCQILSEYAKECQIAGLAPIVEPEVVYDGNYTIEECEKITAKILDTLFLELARFNVNLRACILKVNMITAGKQYKIASTPEEVGEKTAKVLKEHVPENLAGVVFLSGGQTPEQATKNLAEITKNGPFPWPVTFSFARALQDPALYTWKGDNADIDASHTAFLERLIANTKVL